MLYVVNEFVRSKSPSYHIHRDTLTTVAANVAPPRQATPARLRCFQVKVRDGCDWKYVDHTVVESRPELVVSSKKY